MNPPLNFFRFQNIFELHFTRLLNSHRKKVRRLRIQSPFIVLNQTTERDTGRKAPLSGVATAKHTNDGNSILREIVIVHPAAKPVFQILGAKTKKRVMARKPLRS
jgi:hypothetical protein